MMVLRTEVFMGRTSTKLINGSMCRSRLFPQTCSFGIRGMFSIGRMLYVIEIV